MLRDLPCAVGVWLLVLGCGSDRTPEQTHAVVGGLAGTPIAATPVLSISSENVAGQPQFLDAAGATLLADGAVVVADRRRPGILFFDQRGRLVRVVGRKGSDLGEFQFPAWVLHCSSDSLYVWDSRLARMTVMDSAGKVVRDFFLPHLPYRLSCAVGGPLAVLDRPAIIERMDPRGRSLRRYFGTLWLADGRGAVRAVIGQTDLAENRPLGRLTNIAVGGNRIYVGTAESAFVDVRSVDGRSLPSISVGVARREATAADYERAIDRMVHGFTDRAYRERMRKEISRIPKPKWLPIYGEIFADPGGTLWIVISAPADSETVLRVIGHDGRVLGDVSLLSNAKVLEIGREHIIALESLEAPGQRIVVYKVPRQTLPSERRGRGVPGSHGSARDRSERGLR